MTASAKAPKIATVNRRLLCSLQLLRSRRGQRGRAIDLGMCSCKDSRQYAR